jgi:hypothetical protein
MKIVKEHINEIKKGESGWKTIGVGNVVFLEQLKKFIHNMEPLYLHDLHDDRHGKYIANLLNLPIKNIKQVGFGPITWNECFEVIDMARTFGDEKEKFVKIQRGPYNIQNKNYKKEIKYYVWNEPNFILEEKPTNDSLYELNMYCNKEAIDDRILN